MRMWDYYLALSEAGFATGLVQDQQIVLEKSRGVCSRRVSPGRRLQDSRADRERIDRASQVVWEQ